MVSKNGVGKVTKDEEVKKREAPAFLQPLVMLDKKTSSWLAVCATQSSTLGNLRKHMKFLEISCHGIPWLAACIGAIFIFTTFQMQQFFVNLLIALLLDCLFVAVIKAAVRRGRPRENVDDMFATVSLDGYAFPSGHASRAVLLFFVSLFKSDFSLFLLILVACWSLVVCLSRIVMARHHVGDVLAGCLLGYAEYLLMDRFWLGEEGTNYILSYFDSEGGADF